MIRCLIDDDQGWMFEVSSTSEPENPNIVNFFYDDMKWFCTCPDFHFRKHKCKHIEMVEEYIEEEYEKYMLLSEANMGMI